MCVWSDGEAGHRPSAGSIISSVGGLDNYPIGLFDELFDRLRQNLEGQVDRSRHMWADDSRFRE
jgi:hypothetical protein